MILRPYQGEAVAAIYRHLRERDDNPCCVIPTGGGKTPIMATICRDAVTQWRGRVLILAHVKELLEQAYDKLQAMAPDLYAEIGIYSAGLNSRDTDHNVILAGIQSVYRRADELGPFDLVLIDEAHMIPPEGDGMYRTFLDGARAINPNVRFIGLTATPYRMTSGAICDAGNVLNHVCYEVGVRELIAGGYLCPLKSKAGKNKADTSELHIRGGEFIANEVEALMDTRELVRAACNEIMGQTKDRRSVLIFAAGVDHGEHVARVLRDEFKADAETIFGGTLPFIREETLARFRRGELKYLVNVNVLTTGFDAPNIDCIAMLRPTNSPGLYYQMVGRGFRLAENKADCLVLDFGGNIMRHGPVDMIEVRERKAGPGQPVARECPNCQTVMAAAYSTCPECGHEFTRKERERHDSAASAAGVLSGEITEEIHDVMEVYYAVHHKRGGDETTPRTMRVEYRIGFNEFAREWVCPEHTGYARNKFVAWWTQRSNAPLPDSAEDAVDLADRGALAQPSQITVRKIAGEKFDRVIEWELGPVPQWREPGWDDVAVAQPVGVENEFDYDDIPF